VSGRAQALRALLEGPELVVVPECYSALTARIVEAESFPAVYCGGSALSAMHFGIPDYGLITTTEMIELAERIAASVSIPLIVDADQAGETSLNVRRTVRSYEQIGVAGIHIEDTHNPKHAGTGGDLTSVGTMCARIAAAVEARESSDFIVIARTDSLVSGCSTSEAINRGRAYAAAGADVFMCLRTPSADLDAIADNVPIPLLDINHPLAVAGGTKLKVDVFTGTATRMAAAAHRELLHNLRANGIMDDGDTPMVREDYLELLNSSEWLAEARRWSERDL
jgi:2-methylisocitrate lyase-like PEP mutase family enzyme